MQMKYISTHSIQFYLTVEYFPSVANLSFVILDYTNLTEFNYLSKCT